MNNIDILIDTYGLDILYFVFLVFLGYLFMRTLAVLKSMLILISKVSLVFTKGDEYDLIKRDIEKLEKKIKKAKLKKGNKKDIKRDTKKDNKKVDMSSMIESNLTDIEESVIE